MQIATRVTQISASASHGQAREHAVVIDRPLTKGGSDRGPMGGELLLIGVGGCLMSNLLAAAASRGISLIDTRIDVVAELGGEPPRFTAIRLEVSGGTADRALLSELVTTAEASCISVNTLRSEVALSVALLASTS